MGTPDFAVGTLEEIIRAGHEVVLVVTQPDKPKGRGKEMQFPPVKECAFAHDIEVFQPKRIRDDANVEYLKKYDADIIIVAAFGQILPKSILDMPRFGCVNVHASLLPKYRGAAPIQWAVINGDAITGVTTMRMDVGLDTGDMIAKREVRVAEDETGGSLFDKLAKKPAVELERLIRGLNPWPSAYTHLGNKTFKIWKAKVIPENSEYQPGCIVRADKHDLIVQTGAGQLALLEVQLEGKKRMEADAFLRGNQVETGTFFS